MLERALPILSTENIKSNRPLDSSMADYQVVDRFGSRRVNFKGLFSDLDGKSAADTYAEYEPDVLPWRALIKNLPYRKPWVFSYVLRSSGWPCYCVVGASCDTVAPGQRMMALVTLDSGGKYWVCTRPYWPGLAANTAIYAFAWWFGLFGFAAIRRRVRMRRGCCPMCAYDLRHKIAEGCPECGWNRTPTAVTSRG